MSDDLCESGCGPAVINDSEGTPLCKACDDALQLDAVTSQAAALEREAILALINVRYHETWKQMADAVTEHGPNSVRDSRAFGRVDELARLMQAIRNGEHTKGA